MIDSDLPKACPTPAREQPRCASPAAAGGSSAWARLAPHLLIFALLLAQLFLFRGFAIREIVGNYPRHFDQAVYLERAYEVYERMVRELPVCNLHAAPRSKAVAKPL